MNKTVTKVKQPETNFHISDDHTVPNQASSDGSGGHYFGDVVQRRINRRSFLKGSGALGAALVVPTQLLPSSTALARVEATSGLGFTPIGPSFADQVVVPRNYRYNVILKWGDPLFPNAPHFDVHDQSADSQSRQFGFNCDFIGFFPLPNRLRDYLLRFGPIRRSDLNLLGRVYPSLSQRHTTGALLVVNHEYTSGNEMFPEYNADNPTDEQCATEIAAHGASVVAIGQTREGAWQFIKDSPFNRRITGETPIAITGPLRGHPLLRTSGDPAGKTVRGMFNNCAGGKTPWGTVLSCEENFDQYFANFASIDPDSPQAKLSTRIAAEDGETERKWERFDRRFDLAQEPNEYARFGYVVEIDPYDPESTPKKLTALGRFKHEGAATTLTRDRRAAVYSGDDARFEYIYKFVSKKKFHPNHRETNMNLLSRGTLFVAKFHDDGSGEWIPLVYGQGPLIPDNGFESQAHVLINTRGAADLLGATKMDRPEDVEISPVTGKVYVALTNNTKRTGPSEEPAENAANPRWPNPHGHIIEIREHGDDAGALTFRWDIFMLCGDPSHPDHETFFAGFDPHRVSPIANPDNLVFDKSGNLWIATDGQIKAEDFGWNDAVFAVPVEGSERGFLRQFLSGVPGGEICGPEFSGDNRTFFCGIQHPGEDGGLPNTLSVWPDGTNPPKPGILAVRHERHRKIGA